MGQPAKYLFDIDFAPGAGAKPVISHADHAARIAEAETTAYRNGFAAAEAEARNNAQARAAASLERITATLESLNGNLTAIEARLEAEAVEVAAAVGRKLAPALIAREPLAEIAALATECVRHLAEAPHIVVRVNGMMQDAAQQELETIVRARGFSGRLVVMTDPDIALGDCRIEWADGGINRNRKVAEAVIDEAVARYIAARNSGQSVSDILGSATP